MRIGSFGGSINDGTIDDVVAPATRRRSLSNASPPTPRAEAGSPWGSASATRSSSRTTWSKTLADLGVTEFAGSEFPGNSDEAAATRAAIKQAMS
jgi:hypothetical protein